VKPLDGSKIKDEVTERVCRSLRDAVAEVQNLPGIQRDVIRNVVLDGTSVANGEFVPHRLGRAPQMVVISAPRVKIADLGTVTSGQVLDSGARTFADQPLDRKLQVQIGAFGWAVPITVDVEVW
jgi:hypothetical protein